MSEKKGAYGTTAEDTNFRRKWDKEEYTEKAHQKDAEEKERMKENEERLKQGESAPPFVPDGGGCLNPEMNRKETPKG